MAAGDQYTGTLTGSLTSSGTYDQQYNTGLSPSQQSDVIYGITFRVNMTNSSTSAQYALVVSSVKYLDSDGSSTGAESLLYSEDIALYGPGAGSVNNLLLSESGTFVGAMSSGGNIVGFFTVQGAGVFTGATQPFNVRPVSGTNNFACVEQ